MKTRLILAGAVAALLSACVVTPSPYDTVVTVEPPPPRIEYQGYPPVVGYVWIGGYWMWTGRRHEWVPGRWEAPRPGYRWAPHRWERDGDRWHHHEGRWEPDRSPPRGVAPIHRADPPPRVDREIAPRREPAPVYRSPPEERRRPEARPERDYRRDNGRDDRPGRPERFERRERER